MEARILHLQALSPVHTGTGQAVSVIDLPVAREKATNWPYIPGSSIKGVLRALCDPGKDPKDPEQRRFEEAFGPPTVRADEGAGALLFGDARLLCLPVRSLYGTFAWVSSPLALDRYRRDHAASGLATPPSAAIDPPQQGAIIVPPGSALVDGRTVYLDDLDLAAHETADLAPLATAIAAAVFDDPVWHAHFLARFGVVSDTTFSFLAETGTEVAARIQLQEKTKTVKPGALWYEESIPAETIFSAPLLAAPRNGTSADSYYSLVLERTAGLVQIGGHASIGRGLMSLKLTGGAA